jgi:hypothetical protein
VRLIPLLILGAAAAYLYKRFVTDANAGAAETANAEPYSSEQLGNVDSPAPAEPAGQAQAEEQQKDTLERPTWLKPADAQPADPQAADAGPAEAS